MYLGLRGAERRVLDLEVPGPVRLVYYRQGPPGGEPWMLLHGMGSFALGWRHVLRALGRRPAAGSASAPERAPRRP
jgi:pimeloyl-ACP methyl ester carboxylesterase